MVCWCFFPCSLFLRVRSYKFFAASMFCAQKVSDVCPQLVNGETETFVWSEAPTSGKVEWRSTCLESGAPSLTLTGLMTMLQLPAANLVTSDLVYIAAKIPLFLSFS